MVICGVILIMLAAMGVLAATDPDRRRGRSGVTLDTEYPIRAVAEIPDRPATPVRDSPTRIYGVSVKSINTAEPVAVPRTPSRVSRPYNAPVPTRASKVHDRHHCPGCMCNR